MVALLLELSHQYFGLHFNGVLHYQQIILLYFILLLIYSCCFLCRHLSCKGNHLLKHGTVT